MCKSLVRLIIACINAVNYCNSNPRLGKLAAVARSHDLATACFPSSPVGVRTQRGPHSRLEGLDSLLSAGSIPVTGSILSQVYAMVMLTLPQVLGRAGSIPVTCSNSTMYHEKRPYSRVVR